MALNYTTITGTFKDGSGAPLAGNVTFTPNQTVYAAGIPVATPGAPVVAEIAGGQLLNANGGALTLLATDNSGLTFGSGTGFFFWTVSLQFGQVTDTWSFFLPSSPATADLYTLKNSGIVSGLYVPLAGGTMTGALSTPDLAVQGLTGATAASRYAGATASGSPVSGTFATGDVVVDQTGKIWICTAAGTPGTWAQAGAALDGNAGDIRPSPGTAAAGSTGKGADAGHVHGQPPVFAPTGLTGATAASRYAGATVSGAPVSGTFAVGDWVQAQDGPVWLCSAAGTPGSWKQSGDQPWQFRPEAYGAQGDGKIISDGYMTNGSAVLTTQGLQAPSAPTLAHGSTGNTVPAGVYLVKITYVNAYGETLASSSSSVTVASGENLVISSPADNWLSNASGWYAYVTQAGQSTYFRQQSPGSPTAIGSSLTLTANPTTTGLNPPGSNTTGSNPFVSGDVGKQVLIWVNSASHWVLTTIASYQSAGQVTLNATAPAAITQCGFAYGTDDTSSIQAAVNAAFTYAQQVGQGFAEVVLRPAIYCVAAAPVLNATTLSNSQIYLPYVDALSSRGLEIKLTGAMAHKRMHWWQPEPVQGGTIMLGMRLDGAFDNTYGPTSVIGGPYKGMGGDLGTYSNANITVDGITVVTPPWPGGTPYCGMQLLGQVTARVTTFSYLPLAPWLTTLYTSTVWPYVQNVTSLPSYGHFGLMMPATGLNSLSDIGTYICLWAQYGLVGGEHLSAVSLVISYCSSGFLPAQGGHGTTILKFSCENTPFPLDTVGGSFPFGGVGAQVNIAMLSLETYQLVFRTRGAGGGALLGVIYFEDQNTAAGHYFTGGLNDCTSPSAVRTIFAQGGPGLVTPPAVAASGTAVGNFFYRDATVNVQPNGATITAIAVDGTTLTGVTSGLVRVPGDHKITLTYSGGTPAWQWFLD